MMKFGGTSVEDARAIRRAGEIVGGEIGKRGERCVVVVSAMAKVTDTLLGSIERASTDASAASSDLQVQVFARYRHAADELLSDEACADVYTAIDKAASEADELLQTLQHNAAMRLLIQDVVVSYGERLSSVLLAAALNAKKIKARFVDARRCVITDEAHTRAAPLIEETNRNTQCELKPLLKQNIVPVLGGFIGSAVSGATTTLGRGGSDYTAALIGAALDASEIQIWTDVTGVMTADPRVVARARTVPHLTYEEAAELAYFGAKVLHPKTIQPAVANSIPVRVCNSKEPDAFGTLIQKQSPPLANPSRVIKSIAHKKGITILRITAAQMLGSYGFMRRLFEVFERHGTSVDVVTTSEVSVSLTLDDATNLESITRDLRELGSVEVSNNHAIICVVGERLLTTKGVATRVFRHLENINISLISQGASSVNITFVVDERHAGDAVKRLHQTFFETFGYDDAADLVQVESRK